MMLPNDVINEILLFHNPYKEFFNLILIEMKIKHIKKALQVSNNIYLIYFGIETDLKNNFLKRKDFNFKDFNLVKNIKHCIDEIRTLFIPSKTFIEHSYGGKHYIEKYRDQIKNYKYKNKRYITNGEFILAMLLSGYKFKVYSPNMAFNAKRNKKIEKLIYSYKI